MMKEVDLPLATANCRQITKLIGIQIPLQRGQPTLISFVTDASLEVTAVISILLDYLNLINAIHTTHVKVCFSALVFRILTRDDFEYLTRSLNE